MSSSVPAPSPTVVPAPWQLRSLFFMLPVCLTLLVFDGSLLTAHVLINSTAFLLLFPEGALAGTHNIWLRRPVRMFTSHVAFQMTGLMVALLGTAAMLLHQHAKKAPHFVSFHSWFGVSSILCAEFGGLIGALAFSGIMQLSPDHLALMRYTHRLLGRLALLLSSIAMLFGLHIFDIHHPRHKGWKTYAVAVAICVHAVGMHSILWYTMPISWHFLVPRQQGEVGSRATPAAAAFPLRSLTPRAGSMQF